MSASDEQLKQMGQFIDETQPTSDLDIVLAYAYCSVHFEATQVQYSKVIDISDRSLRQKVADNREAFDSELEEQKKVKEPDTQFGNLENATLTEEQLQQFLDALVQDAIKPNANPKQRQMLIDFAGLDGQDLLNLTTIQHRTLRWFIKNELSKIAQYMDTRQLGLMLEESNKLYQGDADKEAVQRFVNSDIEDDSFKQELMYWGLIFMSMYNQIEHPDLQLMEKAVRLDRIQKEEVNPLNKSRIKQYAKAKDIKQDQQKPISNEKLRDKWAEVFGKEDADKFYKELKESKKTSKPPEIDKEDVQQRASEHEDELTVLLSTEEEIQAMFQGKDVFGSKSRKNKQKGIDE